jgi:starch synthase (maltosyl-transferring)
MFAIRATLAATMSPTWGVYSGFELYEGTPVKPGSEEYLDSEKYELRPRDFEAALNRGRSLEPYLTQLNEIRRAHPSLQQLREILFHEVDNEHLIAYSKLDPATGDQVLVVCTLDSLAAQEGTVKLDMPALGLRYTDVVDVHDEISGQTFRWGEYNFVRLVPQDSVAHVLRLPAQAPLV